MKDGKWNWWNKIDYVTWFEELDALDLLLFFFFFSHLLSSIFSGMDVTCMKLVHTSLQGRSPTPSPLCQTDKKNVVGGRKPGKL